MSPPPGNPASPANEPPPPPAPLIAPTGNTSVDALASAVNAGAQPFQQLGNPKANTLDRVTNVVSGAVGSLGALDQLLNTGMAMIPGANLVPGMPAAFIGVPHLGVPHAHAHPPSDGLPMPSCGMTIGSGCLRVLYGGMPAARVLDIGLAPTCGGFAPIFEICTGSSNTFIGGARAARMALDLTRHCNPLGMSGTGHAAQEAEKASALKRAMHIAGMAAPVASGGLTAADQAADGAGAAAVEMTAAQTAADAIAMAMSNLMGKDPGVEPGMGTLIDGDASVLIGGFPMPDALAMLMLGWGLRKKAHAPEDAGESKRTEQGECKGGHPVDVVRGTAENEFTDYQTVDAPAFKWERYYRSDWSDRDGALGFGFRHSFQHELHVLRTRAIYVDPHGRAYVFRRSASGRYEDVFAGYELEQHGESRFVLLHGTLGEFTFERATAAQASARLVRRMHEGVESTMRYAGDGTLRHIEQIAGREQRRQVIDLIYDARGHIVELRVTDPRKVARCVASYRYDAVGCLVTSTDALGASMSFGYDTRRRMIRETDANGYSFSYRYDSDGRCVESAGQDGLWRVLLDYQPGRTVVTQADGGRWTYLYDAARTVTRIVDPYGGATERVTSDDGRIVEEVDSGGRVMRWLYDERGENTGRLDRWGNRWPTRDEAPVLPNPLAHVVPARPLELLWGDVKPEDLPDRLLLPPEIEAVAAAAFPHRAGILEPAERRDGAGRVIARTNKSGYTECLHRDAAGNVVHMRDRDGRDYRYTIASWNLRASETDPLGHTVRYRYSRKHETTAIVDANGNESTYTYDYKNRLTRIARHGTIRESYAYDAGDRVIEKRDGADNTLLRFEVGDNGLHSKRILASGETHSYEYDRHGNFTRASTDKFEVTLTYDAYGRRTGDKRDGRGIEHSFVAGRLASTIYFGRFVVYYEMDTTGDLMIRTPGGDVHRLQRAADGTVLLRLGNRTNVLYGFDADGRCTGRLSWPEGRTAEYHCVQYRYSAVGELQCVTDSTGGTTEYQYDVAHRLVGESRNGLTVRRFEYDRGGNLLSTPTCQWMRYTEGNRLSDAACGAFRYNSRNHLAGQIDENNCRTLYRYNSMDLLLQVEWSDRDDVWTADYDGLCRRACKAMNGRQTDFYWDGDRLAAEKGPDGRIRIYLYVNEEAFLPFMFIDYPTEHTLAESGQAYFVFCAHAGLPEWIENSDGREVWRSLNSDPYGLVDVAQTEGERVDYNLRWPGHYFDPETTLHYNRFRSYSPHLGRYLQSDPAGQSGGINLYTYTANPLTYVDVMGLSCPHGEKTESECPECGRISEDPEVVRLTDEKDEWKGLQKVYQEEFEDETGYSKYLVPPNTLGEYHAIKGIITDLEKRIEAARKAADRRPVVVKYAEKVNSHEKWGWEDFATDLSEGQKEKIRKQAIDEKLVPYVPYKPMKDEFGNDMLDADNNVIFSQYPDFSKVVMPDGRVVSVIEKTFDMPKHLWQEDDNVHFREANENAGGKKPYVTWHHSEIGGRLERVPLGWHNMINHIGGRSEGHWAHMPGGRK
ncbi:RHS repeat-associated core domain-containing protein [Paraburkholderia sp. JHI869]|uniref:RHS repeat-associated core domain-containing protein n=1 Tax=Paraburkholderia sp. JHI869 TaxID=3112959 RepID=UPI00316B75C9